MSPTFSRGKSGRAYRYYVSASLKQGAARKQDGTIRSIPAPALETLLRQMVERWLGAAHSIEVLTAIRLSECGILVDLPAGHAADVIARRAPGDTILHCDRQTLRVEVALALPLRGGKQQIKAAGQTETQADATLVAALRKAHRMTRRERGMPIVDAAPQSPYDRMILRLAFLAPDLQRDILAGRQPARLNLERLRKMTIPLDWNEQRKALGWPI